MEQYQQLLSLYSAGGKWRSTEFQQNDTDRGKNTVCGVGWEDGLSQWQFVDYKSHVDWPGIEVEPP